MNKCRVVIIGGKGTAVNIADQINHANKNHGYPMEVEGFCIDDSSLGNSIAGYPVVCGLHDVWSVFQHTEIQFIYALYRPDVMKERIRLLMQLGIPLHRYANFIHPSAVISSHVNYGYGNIILSNATLQYNVKLGNHNIINSNVVIEHESSLGNSIFIAASVCLGARVYIHDGTFIGLSASVREDVSIGEYSFIGMSSTVLNDVQPNCVVYGSPAKTRP